MYVYAQTYVVHVRTAHEYARTPTRQRQYGWSKSTNMKTFKCDGDLVLYRRGRGGGGGGGGRSSRLIRSPESDPNARGRVRGIALLCVQMKNHHTSRQEQIAMHLNQVANQFRFCGAKLLCNFKKVNYSLLGLKIYRQLRFALCATLFNFFCSGVM